MKQETFQRATYLFGVSVILVFFYLDYFGSGGDIATALLMLCSVGLPTLLLFYFLKLPRTKNSDLVRLKHSQPKCSSWENFFFLRVDFVTTTSYLVQRHNRITVYLIDNMELIVVCQQI